MALPGCLHRTLRLIAVGYAGCAKEQDAMITARGHHRFRQWQPRRPDAQTHRRQVGRDRCSAATPTATASKGIPRLRKAICTWYAQRYGARPRPGERGHRHHRLERGPGAPDARHAGPRRYRAGAKPELPDPIYGAIIAGADIRSVKMTDDVDLRGARARGPRASREAEDADPRLPVEPDRQCVDLAFFEKIVALAKEHGIWSHDLAYADLGFDGWKAPSIGR